MYELYVKQKIEQGIADVEAQRIVPHDRVKAELLDSRIVMADRELAGRIAHESTSATFETTSRGTRLSTPEVV